MKTGGLRIVRAKGGEKIQVGSLPENARRPFQIAIPIMALALLIAEPAMAVRPFVTDDARVAGRGTALLETSIRWDKTLLQNLNIATLGFTERLEATLGFTDGIPLEGEGEGHFGASGPVFQLKALLFEAQPNRTPGLAISAGATAPYGAAGLRVPSWTEFFYAAVTESLGEKERVLIHANLGFVSTRPEEERRKTITTWGIGAQIRLIGGLHSVSEIFYGDPYSGEEGGAFQVGFRHFISENIQVDATVGSGLWGSPRVETFVGFGFRIVFDHLW